MIEIDDPGNEAFAVIKRAKELVIETSDAGQNQFKLLTLALLFYYRADIASYASRLNRATFPSRAAEEIQKLLDNPDPEILAQMTDRAVGAIHNAVQHAALMLKVYDLYKMAGGKL